MKYNYVNMDELTRPKNHPYRLNSDCYITSIASLLNLSYKEVYDDLFDLARSRLLQPNDPTSVLPDYLKFYGFEMVMVYDSIDELTDENAKDFTVQDAINMFPDHYLLMVVRKHMFGFKYNTIYNDVRHKDGSTDYTEEDEKNILNSRVAYFYRCKLPRLYDNGMIVSLSLKFKGRYATMKKEDAKEAFKTFNAKYNDLNRDIYLRYGKEETIVDVPRNQCSICDDTVTMYAKLLPGIDVDKLEALPLNKFKIYTDISAIDGTYSYAEEFAPISIKFKKERRKFSL